MSLTSIRNRISTRIQTLGAYSTANVRMDKFSGDPVVALPTVCIYHLSTTRQPITIGPTRTHQNSSTFAIEIHADKGAATNLQDNLDTQGAAIAGAIDTDRTLNGTCFEAVLSGIDDGYSSEGDKPRGMRRLTYDIIWMETITN